MDDIGQQSRWDRRLGWGCRFLQILGGFQIMFAIYLVGLTTYLLLTGRTDQLSRVSPALLIGLAVCLPTGLRLLRIRPQDYLARSSKGLLRI